MYFITKKDSKTGLKFKEVVEKLDLAFGAQDEMAKKYKIKSWRALGFHVAGDFSSIEFKKSVEVDSKLWKETLMGEYMPKLNSKAGKAIQKITDALTEDTRVYVTGYASPPASVDYNLTLSEDRAEAVVAKLLSNGVSLRQIVLDYVGEVDTTDGKNVDLSRRVRLEVK